MGANYLEQRKINLDNSIDCLLTSNIDERYLEIYPQIEKQDILELSSRYPLEDYDKIKAKIKNHFNIKTDLVFGSGSEELIIRLNDIAKSHNYKVVLVIPLFYRVRETFRGEKICIKEERLFDFDYSNYDVVWFQNPNLFSGKSHGASEIEELLKRFPMVNFFIDEAGIFTLPNWKTYSMLGKCHQYDNLVVLSTFSKIYGLAGLRIGFATGSRNLLIELEENNLTFPMSSFAEFYLSEVLNHEDLIDKLRLKIIDHKKQLTDILRLNPDIVIKESLTNCLFFKHKDKKIYNFLLKEGIICLDLDNCKELMDEGYVRMTVHSSKTTHRQIMVKLKKLIINI